MKSAITVDEWHELSEDKKEVLRKWAVTHNYGLDIVNSISAATCDYAALLSPDQMKHFLYEQKSTNSLPVDCNYLWSEVKKALNK